jgi:hypothetical protein
MSPCFFFLSPPELLKVPPMVLVEKKSYNRSADAILIVLDAGKNQATVTGKF